MLRAGGRAGRNPIHRACAASAVLCEHNNDEEDSMNHNPKNRLVGEIRG
jgi:hypothetical protein